MKNKYRFYLFIIILFISLLLIITDILLGILLKSSIPCIIVSMITLYIINGLIALWIVTSKNRTSLTKTTWMLAFFIFPFISLIIYFIWGISPYENKTINDYKETYKGYLSQYPDDVYINNSHVYNRIAQFGLSARDAKNTSFNKIEMIKTQKEFGIKCIEAIKSATKSILLSYYIIDNGEFYKELAKELCKKADEGIKIFLMFDRYGCTSKFTTNMLFNLLKHDNIQIAKFESDKDIKWRSTNNFRSHKKILIIDGYNAIYGGTNISDEYLCIRKKYPNWMDLNFNIYGNIVKTMTVDFCMDWDNNGKLPYIIQLSDYINCNKFLKLFLFFKSYLFLHNITHKQLLKINKKRMITKTLLKDLQDNDLLIKNNHIETSNISNAVYIPTGPRFNNNILSDILNVAFMNSLKSIKIISPYLQLTENLISSLICAKHSGINVELIVPGTCDDKFFLLDMNRMQYIDLLNEGIKIYEYSGFIHSKLIIIDDSIALTGTYNLDYRSLKTNYESILMIEGKEIINELNNYYTDCINHSYHININNYKTTLKEAFIQTCLHIIKPLL